MKVGPKFWRSFHSLAGMVPNIQAAHLSDAQGLIDLLNQIIETGVTMRILTRLIVTHRVTLTARRKATVRTA